MSRIGEALLSVAMKDENQDGQMNVKRSNIHLKAKSMNPKRMVLESVRLPKKKGRRSIESEEENLMSIEEKQGNYSKHNQNQKTKAIYLLHYYHYHICKKSNCKLLRKFIREVGFQNRMNGKLYFSSCYSNILSIFCSILIGLTQLIVNYVQQAK